MRASTLVSSAGLGLAVLAAALPGQRDPGAYLASSNYVLLAPEVGAGGSCSSTKYKLHGSFGGGAVAARATSTGFVLLGGSPAADRTATTGKPVLAAVRPLRAFLDVRSVHDLLGAELALGTGTSVKVDGLPATVLGTTRDRVRIRLPVLTRPGWLSVEVKNAGGVSRLPQGLAVKPFLDMERPLLIGRPTRLRYEGRAGDLMVWIFAAGRFGPTKIPPFKYGLGLNLASLILLPPLFVTDPGGLFELPLPGLTFARPLNVQVLSLWKSQGYKGGSFTNVLDL